MYLTRFRINTQRIGARKLLSSPQVMHAAVLSAFAENPQQDDGPRVLWRLDGNNRNETHLCIVSPLKPDLMHLVEQVGWPSTARWDTYDYGPFLQELTAGQRWSFRLTANPVHTARRTDDEPTKITAHVGPLHQLRWLLKREQNAGFRIVRTSEDPDVDELAQHDLVIHNRRQLEFQKRGMKKPVSLVTVTFDGHLDITDPEPFRRTLTHGLGRAKAYGCGLMTLAKA